MRNDTTLSSETLGAAHSLKQCRPLCLLVAMICCLYALFPADAPWINDEPALIHNALQANTSGSMASAGLMGTQGVRYGPLPTWIYQLGLLLTHDLLLLVSLRAILFTLLVAAALYVIARAARLPAWGLLVLLSPHIWGYSRQLWDNSFCIPLSAALVALYLVFLSGRPAALVGVVLMGFSLLLTHLMAAPLLMAVTTHALLFRRRAVLAAWPYLLTGLLCGGAIGLSYWPTLLHGLGAGGRAGVPDLASLWHTLRGGEWLAGNALMQSPGEAWLRGTPASFRLLATIMPPLLVASCLGSAALALYQLYRVGRPRAPVAAGIFQRLAQATPAEHLILLSMLTLACQYAVFGIRNIGTGEHYYNASWWAYWCLLWTALARVGPRWAKPLAAGLALLLSLATLQFAALVHATGGSRSLFYGPSLGEQTKVAAAISMSGPAPIVQTDIELLALMPLRLQTLSELLPPAGPEVRRTSIRVGYASASPRDGHLEVTILPFARRGSPLPPPSR